MDFVAVLERLVGRPAKLVFEPMQPGDVPSTYADIEDSRRDLGFEPITSLEAGLERFVDWYREYHAIPAIPEAVARLA